MHSMNLLWSAGHLHLWYSTIPNLGSSHIISYQNSHIIPTEALFTVLTFCNIKSLTSDHRIVNVWPDLETWFEQTRLVFHRLLKNIRLSLNWWLTSHDFVRTGAGVMINTMGSSYCILFTDQRGTTDVSPWVPEGQLPRPRPVVCCCSTNNTGLTRPLTTGRYRLKKNR